MATQSQWRKAATGNDTLTHTQRVRTTAATTTMSAWHWQERYDVSDPEQACRLQVLQVQKEISFAKWLQQKKAKQAAEQDNSLDDAQADEEKRQECEKRFREWVRSKQREKKQAQDGKTQSETGERRPLKRDDQPFSKPPSLHVNPRIKRARGDSVKGQPSKSNGAHKLKKSAPPEQCLAAYQEWERRKLREDPIKRKHRQLNQLLEEHAQRQRHLTIWRKKEVVCAYSTNRRSDERASATSNKLRAA